MTRVLLECSAVAVNNFHTHALLECRYDIGAKKGKIFVCEGHVFV